MGNHKNYNKNLEQKKAIDVEATPVQQEQSKPTVDKGNYIIDVISEGEIIKRIAVANAEINITKLQDGGLAVDLK